MDLTQLTHTLTISGTTHTIDEPVNFDSMRLVMKRNTEYHGISIETTEATLQFYDSPDHTAASLIKTAYETDIDSDITYTVTDTSTTAIVYQGKLDLSTYNEKQGSYFAVECKVGEIGIKTTFNNRTETEIDLLGNTTMGGQALAHVPIWKNLPIPAITLNYINILATDNLTMTESTVASGRFHLPENKAYHFIGLKVADKTTLNEFGDFNVGFADIADQITPQTTLANEYIDDYYQPIFSREEINAFKTKYGEDATYNITVNLTIGLTFSSALFPTTEGTSSPITTYTGKYAAELVLLAPLSKFGSPYAIIHGSRVETLTNSSQYVTTLFTITGTVRGIRLASLRLGILLENQTTYHTNTDPTERRANRNYQVSVVAQSFTGGSITMTLNSKMDDATTKAEMLPIHEALNIIVENISDNALTVKSTYYGRCDSQVNPITGTNTFGNGSLKAITNGYKLRNGYTEAGAITHQIPISFRSIIEALDAMDCIGWGFTTESGQTCLRVEKWDYFYKNQVILTIDNPDGTKRTLDNDRIVTELSIGYKKYVTNEEMNSCLAIHSEQTYNNQCKAISRQKNRLCSFIADFYAIEETRRKQLQNDTSEFKYDDNIFVFELSALEPLTASGSITYAIPTNYITQTSGIPNPAELYNMRITPHRNASRWHSFLRWKNHAQEFKCVSTKQNTNASFDNTPPSSMPTTMHLLDITTDITKPEQGDLKTLTAATPTKKEIVSITYPLTLTQYQALKANPYGIIRVDSHDYWLQEATYEFKTSKTDLKLIPKTNN